MLPWILCYYDSLHKDPLCYLHVFQAFPCEQKHLIHTVFCFLLLFAYYPILTKTVPLNLNCFSYFETVLHSTSRNTFHHFRQTEVFCLSQKHNNHQITHPFLYKSPSFLQPAAIFILHLGSKNASFCLFRAICFFRIFLFFDSSFRHQPFHSHIHTTINHIVIWQQYNKP